MKEEISEKKDNTKKNIVAIDKIIQELFKGIVSTSKSNSKDPFSFNVQFFRDFNAIDKLNNLEQNTFDSEINIEDMDSIILDENYLYLTLFMPHSQNNLLFDVDNKKGILAIATQDTSFYKEFHFKMPVKKETLEVKFNNNVLELKFELERK